MSKISFEEYLEKYPTLTYKNVGVSMLPLLKQGRDSFTIHRKEADERLQKWDVVMYKREPGEYVLHRIIVVHENSENSYDILGDNCIGIEKNIPETAVIGKMTEFTHRNKAYKVTDFSYKLYVTIWCKPYHLRIFLKKSWLKLRNIFPCTRKDIKYDEK